MIAISGPTRRPSRVEGSLNRPDRTIDAVFHPAVERFLTMTTVTYPGATRARSALQTLLHWTEAAVNPWAGSTLSMPGFPIELAFSTADRSLRYCVEIADPASDPRQRLATAANLLSQMSTVAPKPDVLDRLSNLQADRELKYGAWIGGRHSKNSDRYKLYVEVPIAAASAADDWSAELSGMRHDFAQHARVEMIGYDPAARRIEFYRRGRNLSPVSIRIALRRLRLDSRAEELFGLLQRAHRFSLAGRLPSGDCGYSESFSQEGAPTIFSLYFFARSMFGGDGSTRAAILRLAAECGWDLADYESISEPLAGVVGPVTWHGMFGLTVGSQSALAMTLGLVPPAVARPTERSTVLPSTLEASRLLCPASR